MSECAALAYLTGDIAAINEIVCNVEMGHVSDDMPKLTRLGKVDMVTKAVISKTLVQP